MIVCMLQHKEAFDSITFNREKNMLLLQSIEVFWGEKKMFWGMVGMFSVWFGVLVFLDATKTIDGWVFIDLCPTANSDLQFLSFPSGGAGIKSRLYGFLCLITHAILMQLVFPLSMPLTTYIYCVKWSVFIQL